MDRLFISSLWLIVLDQLSKHIIHGTKNYGAAFGILQGYRIIFIIIGLAALWILIYNKKHFHDLGIYGYVLLISGTIGNLIDRIFLGYVRDFINVGFWPSFNLADTFN